MIIGIADFTFAVSGAVQRHRHRHVVLVMYHGPAIGSDRHTARTIRRAGSEATMLLGGRMNSPDGETLHGAIRIPGCGPKRVSPGLPVPSDVFLPADLPDC